MLSRLLIYLFVSLIKFSEFYQSCYAIIIQKQAGVKCQKEDAHVADW